jgi:hypothetical protein
LTSIKIVDVADFGVNTQAIILCPAAERGGAGFIPKLEVVVLVP